MLPTDFAGLIVFLGTPAVIVFLSDWLELQPWFGKLSSQVKQLSVAAIAVVLALASRLLQTTIAPETIAQLDPWYAVAATAINYVVSQIWHNTQHDNAKG